MNWLPKSKEAWGKSLRLALQIYVLLTPLVAFFFVSVFPPRTTIPSSVVMIVLGHFIAAVMFCCVGLVELICGNWRAGLVNLVWVAAALLLGGFVLAMLSSG